MLAAAVPGAAAQTPDTLLLRAARAGDLPGLRAALAAGARVAATDTSGASALMLATVFGREGAAAALLAAGADCRRGAFYRPGRTGFYGSLLAAAAAEGHLTLLKTLIARCRLPIDAPEQDLTGATGWTPLQSAAANGRLAVVQYLADRGASLTGTTLGGTLPPLDLALQQGQDSTAMWLLGRAAPSSMTPALQLFTAAGAGAAGAVEHLLGAGAPVDAMGENDETAFQLALGSGHVALAERLLARGADPLHRNTLGWTALHYAAATPEGAALIPRLAALGVPVGATTTDGVTALGLALLRGHLAPTRALVALGADPATVASDGWTALHIAARDGADGLADTLLAARVPLGPRTTDGGLTPLALAARNGQALVAAKIVCGARRLGPAGQTLTASGVTRPSAAHGRLRRRPLHRSPSAPDAAEAGSATRRVLDLAASGGCAALRPFLDAQADIVHALGAATPADSATALLRRADAAYVRLFGGDPDVASLRLAVAEGLTARGGATDALVILDAVAADTSRLADAVVRTLLYRRALVLGALGRTREAIAAQRALLARERANPDVQPLDRALTEQALAKLLGETGETAEALALARSVLDTHLREVGADTPATYLAAVSVGMALFNVDRRDELRAHVAEWNARIGDPATPGEVRAPWGTLVGILALREGDTDAAEAAYRTALAVRRQLYGDASVETLRSLRDLIELYSARERYAEARPLVDEAMASLERLIAAGQRDPSLIVLLRDVSRALSAQNDLATAEAAARRMVGLAREITGAGSLLEADGLTTLGGVLLNTDRLAAAADAFEGAVAIYDARTAPDYLQRLTSLGALAEVRRRQNDLPAARALLDAVIPVMARTHPNDPSLPSLYNNRSLVLRAAGDREGAAADMRQALAGIDAHGGGGRTELAMRINAASANARTDPAASRALAFEAARMAARQADTVLPALSMAEQQAFLETDLASLATTLVWLTRGRPSADSAYAFLSRYKGLLLRSLRFQADLARTGGPAALALADARRALAAHLLARPAARADSTTTAAWQGRLTRLVSQRETAERRLTAGAAVRLDDPLGAGVDVRSMLRDGEAMLDLYRVARDPQNMSAPDYHYIAAVVVPGVPVRLVDIGRADTLDAFVDAWRDAVRRGGSAAEETRTLRKRLWWPLAETIPGGIHRLWLSPDGQLARLPFDVLARDPRRPFALTTLDSPRDLAQLRRTQSDRTPSTDAASGALLLVGDVAFGGDGVPFAPLPGTRDEIDAVDRLFRAAYPSAAHVELTGAAASGDRVLARMPGAAYVHLATHGTFAATPPGDYAATRTVKPFAGRRDSGPEATTRMPLLESGLAFAGANTLGAASTAASQAQGFVTAEEFVGVDLSAARLVVLSACETGRGREITGQGVMGLRASFVTAGARTLLMSLWPVPDAATARLMERFYGALWRDGAAPGEALRRAQADVAASYPAPVNWAGWILAGEAW